MRNGGDIELNLIFTSGLLTNPVNKEMYRIGKGSGYATYVVSLNFTILMLSWCYLARSFRFARFIDSVWPQLSHNLTERWRENKPAHFRGINPEPNLKGAPWPWYRTHINIRWECSANFHYFYRLFLDSPQYTSKMPAPDITYRQIDSRPALGHVWAHRIHFNHFLTLTVHISNLMVDTFIANASADEWGL